MKKDALAAWSSHFSSSLEKRIVDRKVREERLCSLKFGRFELRWQMMGNQVLFQCGTENIPHISSNANMPLLWIIGLFNCAEEILTHNLLSSYPVHCAFKHYYEKLAMKNAWCWSSEKLIQQEKNTSMMESGSVWGTQQRTSPHYGRMKYIPNGVKFWGQQWGQTSGKNHLVMGRPHFILLCMFEHTGKWSIFSHKNNF